MFKSVSCFVFLLLFSFGPLANQTDGSDVRDPTTPLGHVASNASTGAVKQFELNSILIGPQRKLVIINGITLREGQTVPELAT